MGKEYLGEFEELVMLMVAMMKDEAYGLAICDEIESQTGRPASIGAVHATVARLEKKGFVETFMSDPTNERGGRRKRLIRMTNSGKSTLIKSRDAKVKLWTQIPDLALNKI
ncbi:MAG: helix-turn-helix transcriptional regulator [Reichenbachiella sp.]|uniref:PadR family transcriptional regulator n=1 Tax=Reichenbachiella sp. TaxID=2184521 RepID=UPI0032661B02